MILFPLLSFLVSSISSSAPPLSLSVSTQEEKDLQLGLTSPVALVGELQGLVLSTWPHS